MLSVLAMAKLMKSSALEDGAMGLQGAMILANEAHAAFDDAIRLHWFNASLAEAGLVSLTPIRRLLHHPNSCFCAKKKRYSLFLNPPPIHNTRLAVRQTPSSTSTSLSRTSISPHSTSATATSVPSPPTMCPSFLSKAAPATIAENANALVSHLTPSTRRTRIITAPITSLGIRPGQPTRSTTRRSVGSVGRR